MAINLRLTTDDAALVDALAEAEGVSKNEAILRAIRSRARDLGHQATVAAATDEMLQRWGAVLDRLGRA